MTTIHWRPPGDANPHHPVDQALAQKMGYNHELVGENTFLWRKNDFDSTHFNLNMIRVGGAEGSLDSLADDLTSWSNLRSQEGYDHAAVRVDSSKVRAIQALESAGFRYVDSLTILKRKGGGDVKPDPRVVEALPSHLSQIQELSEGAFEEGRYAGDPGLSAEGRASAVRAWTANNLSGRCDKSWAVLEDGVVAGFLMTLWSEESKISVIDLVAVGKDFQGRGYGTALMKTMLAHYAPLASSFSVGTQASNEAAHALYSRFGYQMSHMELGLHADLASKY